MRNLKHTIMAIVSVAMVGTLSFLQVSDLSAQVLERDLKLTTANNLENILILDNDEETETQTETETKASEEAMAQKSSLTAGYAMVTGTVDLKATPGDGAETIGTMSGADSLEILESTEGWYKVMVNGKSGYVKKELVTLDKTESETAAKQLDYYKKGKVTSQSGLMVRTAGSETASSVGIVDCGTDVIIIDTENNYIKIAYGNDYIQGYVINSGLECTGEWVAKTDVHTGIKKAAERQEAARREAARREAARLGAMGYSQKETKSTTSSVTTSTGSASGQALVATAKRYLGVPYVWGGTSPKGFDCSGLVQYVCRQHGISLPRTAASQRGAGTYVSRANLQVGDLVFFKSGGRISHVGIYIGNGNMIHAPQTGDVVKISSINTSYRVNSYAGAVRVAR